VSGSVFRSLVDLALDWSDDDTELRTYLAEVRAVKGISLELLDQVQRSKVEAALIFSCDQARRGGRSLRSGDDCASGEALVVGGERLGDFLASRGLLD
jgi:hypothetical protein